MTRDELLTTLTVERFAPTSRAVIHARSDPAVDDIRTRHNDNDIATARRRRELADAITENRRVA